MNKLSGCVFIKDNFEGAFCLFESMAMIMPLVQEFLILDLGSTDGTFEKLEELSNRNKKVQLYRSSWPKQDANVFAYLANWLIENCTYDNVIYFQADEIWHEDLVNLMIKEFQSNNFDLSFWRIQYRENFQKVKWFPHPVHRVGQKGKFNFVGDGMNSDRYFEPKMVSDYGMEYFPKWGDMGQDKIIPYTNQMISDVSLVGGFLENIVERRVKHAPFWHEEPTIENTPALEWFEKERLNKNWYKKDSPYKLPAVLKWHLGKTKYTFNEQLFEALCNNSTEEYIQTLKGNQ